MEVQRLKSSSAAVRERQRVEVEGAAGIKRFRINYSGAPAKCCFPGLLSLEARRLWNQRSLSVSNNVSTGAEWGRAPAGQQRPTSVGLLMGLFSPAKPTTPQRLHQNPPWKLGKVNCFCLQHRRLRAVNPNIPAQAQCIFQSNVTSFKPARMLIYWLFSLENVRKL